MNTSTRQSLSLLAAGLGAAVLARAAVRRSRTMDLRGKLALITGGSRGLGLVLARRLQREGCRVAICARDPDELDAARRDLERRGSAGGPVHTAVCDVTDHAQVREMVRALRVRLGPIDILVNNAGIIAVGPVHDMTIDDYDLAMRVHFWATLYTTLEVLPAMRARRSGRVCNISSIGGRIPVPHLVPYCASKFAVAGFSAALRTELAQDNVFITTVAPGLMRTGSHVNAAFKGQTQAEYAWFKGSIALPGASVAAESAAARIARAIAQGRAHTTIGLPAAIAERVYGLMPGLTTEALSMIARALPRPGGVGTMHAKGAESESALTRSFLMRRPDRAVARNNEAPSPEPAAAGRLDGRGVPASALPPAGP